MKSSKMIFSLSACKCITSHSSVLIAYREICRILATQLTWLGIGTLTAKAQRAGIDPKRTVEFFHSRPLPELPASDTRYLLKTFHWRLAAMLPKAAAPTAPL
jgi:hypothetical protein